MSRSIEKFFLGLMFLFVLLYSFLYQRDGAVELFSYFVVGLAWCYILLTYRFVRVKPPILFWSVILFQIISIISAFNFIELGLMTVIRACFQSIVFGSCYLFSWCYFVRNPADKFWLRVFGVLFFLVSLYGVYNAASLVNASSEITLLSVRRQTNMGYFVLAALPVAFLYKNRLTRLLFLIVASLFVYLSLKRSLFLVVLCVLPLFFIFSEKRGRVFVSRKNVMCLSIITVLLVVFVGAQVYLNDIYLVSRFQNSLDDGGSGRSFIFADVIKRIDDFDLFSLCIGRGHNSYGLAGIASSAHNEMLEVFYSYGILGFCCWVWMYLILISKAWIRFSNGFPYIQCYLCVLSYLVIVPLFSSVVTYQFFFAFTFLMLGFIDAMSSLRRAKNATSWMDGGYSNI